MHRSYHASREAARQYLSHSLYDGAHQYNLRSHSDAAVVRFECHASHKHGMKQEACDSEEDDSQADGLDRSVPRGMFGIDLFLVRHRKILCVLVLALQT
jgi:hypothetical protein